MSRIPDNKKLIFINIPATHDSAAYYMNRLSFNFAKTQYFSIKKQLEIGTRKFDIRVVDINKNKEIDEDLICCHGICDCYANDKFGDFTKLTYKSILLDIKDFLEQYPSETVMVGVSLGRGDNKDTMTRAYDLLYKYVGDIIIIFNNDLTMGNSRGKIVSFVNFRKEFDDNDKNKVNFHTQSLLNGTGIYDVHIKYRSYATFKVDGNLKIQEMNDMFKKYNMTIEEAENEEAKKTIKFPIEYSISCTGEKVHCLPNPLNQANIVHSFIQKDGVLKKGYYYGWLKMDFANFESNFKLVDTNFID